MHALLYSSKFSWWKNLWNALKIAKILIFIVKILWLLENFEVPTSIKIFINKGLITKFTKIYYKNLELYGIYSWPFSYQLKWYSAKYKDEYIQERHGGTRLACTNHWLATKEEVAYYVTNACTLCTRISANVQYVTSAKRNDIIHKGCIWGWRQGGGHKVQLW